MCLAATADHDKSLSLVRLGFDLDNHLLIREEAIRQREYCVKQSRKNVPICWKLIFARFGIRAHAIMTYRQPHQTASDVDDRSTVAGKRE